MNVQTSLRNKTIKSFREVVSDGIMVLKSPGKVVAGTLLFACIQLSSRRLKKDIVATQLGLKGKENFVIKDRGQC